MSPARRASFSRGFPVGFSRSPMISGAAPKVTVWV